MRALLLLLIVLAATTFAGCEVIGGIFKAGFWVGVIVVLLGLGLVGFVIAKLRR